MYFDQEVAEDFKGQNTATNSWLNNNLLQKPENYIMCLIVCKCE